MEVWDIHNHILFGVDDGAHSLNQALRMLDIAYEEGIKNIILTPHSHPRFKKANVARFREAYRELEAEVKKRYEGLRLYLGCEVYYGDRTLEKLKEGSAIPMADSRYVLLEFDTYDPIEKLKKAVTEMLSNKYKPILAHIERYDCLLDNPEEVDSLIDMGAYIQINAGSVMGNSGLGIKRYTRKLLKGQKVHFIGTDAHKDDRRTPHISKCVRYVGKKYGADYADRVFIKNPQAIINNQEIEERL